MHARARAQAIARLQDALELDPTLTEAHFTIGNALLSLVRGPKRLLGRAVRSALECAALCVDAALAAACAEFALCMQRPSRNPPCCAAPAQSPTCPGFRASCSRRAAAQRSSLTGPAWFSRGASTRWAACHTSALPPRKAAASGPQPAAGLARARPSHFSSINRQDPENDSFLRALEMSRRAVEYWEEIKQHQEQATQLGARAGGGGDPLGLPDFVWDALGWGLLAAAIGGIVLLARSGGAAPPHARSCRRRIGAQRALCMTS
jgi:hypothetical protein